MKIVIDSKIPFLYSVFEPFMAVDYRDAADISPAAVRNADALIVRTRTLCNAALLRGSGVKFIASATVGADHIDADFCDARSIAWTNSAGCNAGAVLQYTASALLEIARRKNLSLPFKTIGIVGAGSIGSRVAGFARQMGMTPLLCDPPRAEIEGSAGFVSLDEIAARADIVTFHVPLTHNGRHPTFHLASRQFFDKFARFPVFINTSRGEVVDETALRQAALRKQISALALDVWENEPFINIETLRLADIGTPHIAGYSAEGKAKAAEMAVQSVARFFDLPLKTWKPAHLPPAVMPVLDDNLNMQDRMYALHRHFYDITADDAALRSAPHAGERLRSEYAFRQEMDFQFCPP